MVSPGKHGTLRLKTGGPLSLPIAVAWRIAEEPFDELYRGKVSSDPATALAEAKKAESQFHQFAASLSQQGWQPVQQEGRNLHFQRRD